MDIYSATEEAYKRGYEAGKRDAVAHGRWIEHMNKFICTNCKGRALLHFGGMGHCLSNHCPHCGAKMDSE